MKNLLIAFCTLSIMVVACKKENKTVTPTTPTTPTTTYITLDTGSWTFYDTTATLGYMQWNCTLSSQNDTLLKMTQFPTSFDVFYSIHKKKDNLYFANVVGYGTTFTNFYITKISKTKFTYSYDRMQSSVNVNHHGACLKN